MLFRERSYGGLEMWGQDRERLNPRLRLPSRLLSPPLFLREDGLPRLWGKRKFKGMMCLPNRLFRRKTLVLIRIFPMTPLLRERALSDEKKIRYNEQYARSYAKHHLSCQAQGIYLPRFRYLRRSCQLMGLWSLGRGAEE